VADESKWASKRREERHPYDSEVTLVLARKTMEATTLDVSFRGFYLEVSPPPPLRSFIQVNFKLPAEFGELELSGMIVHRVEGNEEEGKPPGIGVQLYGNADSVVQNWNRFIQYTGGKETLSPESTNDAQVLSLGIEPEINDIIAMEFTSVNDLFTMYACDIPAGRMFVPTDHNLAIGDHVLLEIALHGNNSVFHAHAQVISQSRQPGDFGVEVALISFDTLTLRGFWDFICDQTPSEYPALTL